MVPQLEKRFPTNPKDDKLYEEIGEGVSASVYRALCIPRNQIVDIKVLDLEKYNNNLDAIRHEVQIMNLIDHPNVLQAHCSFTAGQNLWVVMPYMEGGFAFHIMKYAYREGFDESVIATLLHEVLKALVYLHGQEHIHRDVKVASTNCKASLVSGSPRKPLFTVNTATLLPSLHFLWHQTALQKKQLIKLLRCIYQTSGLSAGYAALSVVNTDGSQLSLESRAERVLLILIPNYSDVSIAKLIE